MVLATGCGFAQPNITCTDFGLCAGSFRICRFNVQENGPITVTCDSVVGGLAITISNVDSPIVAGSPGFIEIYPMANNVNLVSLEINFASTAGAASDVVISVFENNPPNGTLGSIGTIRKGLASSAGTLRLASLSAPVITGPIEAANIGNVISSGNLSGSIVSVPQNGNASTAFGRIGVIRSNQGNITASVTARGRVTEIRADNGTIGLPGAPVLIQTANQIDIVEARGVYANINNQWNYSQYGIDSGVIFLKTTNGPLAGGLTMRQIETSQPLGGLDIAGNLESNIVLGTASSASPGRIEEPVLVRGGFPAGYSITCKGITSQLNFNTAYSVTAPLPTIAGSITVNGVSLSPLPYCNQTRDVLRGNAGATATGGSIALAPYMVHYEECEPSAAGEPGVPLTGENYHAVGGARSTIVLDHYGFVGYRNAANTGWQATPPSGKRGVIVERRLNGSEYAWQDVSASFTVTVDSANGRAIRVSGPFAVVPPTQPAKDYLYRIRPVRALSATQAPLLCRDAGSPTAGPLPVVGDYEFIYLADKNQPAVEELPPCFDC
jgi:hypothetical protein